MSKLTAAILTLTLLFIALGPLGAPLIDFAAETGRAHDTLSPDTEKIIGSLILTLVGPFSVTVFMYFFIIFYWKYITLRARLVTI